MAKPVRTLTVNRAPVLTLWAAVVAERLGHDRESALTLGRALAGLNAQSKGRRLGIYHESEEPAPRRRTRKHVELMGRRIDVVRRRDGVRALSGDAAMAPAAVERYLESKFGEKLPAVRAAMMALARSRTKAELEREAYALYEKFRPAVPAGERGWGARGKLDLNRLDKLA